MTRLSQHLNSAVRLSALLILCCDLLLSACAVVGSATYKPPFIPIEFVIDTQGNISIQASSPTVSAPIGDFSIGATAEQNTQPPNGGLLMFIQHLVGGKPMDAGFRVNEDASVKTVIIDNTVTLQFSGNLISVDARGHHTILLTSPNAQSTKSAGVSPHPTGTVPATRVVLPTATHQLQAKPTRVPPTPSVIPTSTPVPYVDCGSYVDLGNAQSEVGHDVVGWAGTYVNQPPSPSGDTSFRYQPQGSKATVKLCVGQAGVGYTLTTEVQDYGCDDSFEIFINNDPTPIYRYTGTRANVVRVHTIAIPASEIISRDVVLGFESISTDCGYAGVYNVGLS